MIEDGPQLLVSTPIEARLARLEDQAREFAKWEGEDATAVRTIRLCVFEIRQALKEARELWVPTAEAARLTGWSEDTLSRRARELMNGETPPPEWGRVQVQRRGSTFFWRASTIPQKPIRRSA